MRTAAQETECIESAWDNAIDACGCSMAFAEAATVRAIEIGVCNRSCTGRDSLRER